MIKKILLVMLISFISYSQVCYADGITVRAMFSPVSFLGAAFCMVILLVYALSFFALKRIEGAAKKNKEEQIVDEKSEMFEEKTKINCEERHVNRLYFWATSTLACLMYFFYAQFFIPFFIFLIPIILLIISRRMRKKGKKVFAKKLYLIVILIMVLIAIYSILYTMHNKQFLKYTFFPGVWSEGRRTDDVIGLVDEVIENNNRFFSLKVPVIVERRGVSSKREQTKEIYITMDEINELKKHLTSERYIVNFSYDKFYNFITGVEIWLNER